MSSIKSPSFDPVSLSLNLASSVLSAYSNNRKQQKGLERQREQVLKQKDALKY